jgi:hypothetical protein
VLQASDVMMSDCSVGDSHLLPHEQGYSERVYVRGGGAIRVVAGSLFIDGGSFTRCSAGPRDGNFDSCALSFNAATSICTDGLDGAISGERAGIIGQTTRLEATTRQFQIFSGVRARPFLAAAHCSLCIRATICMPIQWTARFLPTCERQSATPADRPRCARGCARSGSTVCAD